MTRKSVTYRDLRNTPGMVFERLAAGEPLALMSEGEAKALLIPVEDGDVDTALEAYRRGRALMALSRLQRSARATGTAALTLDDVTAEVKATRRSRRKREQAG
jgi:antitoxin (DNA-binding transcriptional repressor) of toxin-antitoxin stability system